MKLTALRSLIQEEIKKVLAEETNYPFKFGKLDMLVGQQGKYIYVFPKSMRQFDDMQSMPGAPDVASAIESILRKKGITDAKNVDAPSNIPGFAFVTKSSLEDVAKALGSKGTMNEAGTVYGEKEAIKMIWDDPGNKIESALKKINGYESVAQGASDKELYIYFSSKPAAMKGAMLLQHLIPGPEYKIRTEPDSYSIGIKA